MTIKERIADAQRRELLTVEQFALLTQYHPQSIYRMVRTGKLAVVRIAAHTIRIPRSAARIVRSQHPNADSTLSL